MTRNTRKQSRSFLGPFLFHGGPLDGQAQRLLKPAKIHIHNHIGIDESQDMKHVYRREFVQPDPKPGQLLPDDPQIHYVYDTEATKLANQN